jgi:hypothetical protein
MKIEQLAKLTQWDIAFGFGHHQHLWMEIYTEGVTAPYLLCEALEI